MFNAHGRYHAADWTGNRGRGDPRIPPSPLLSHPRLLPLRAVTAEGVFHVLLFSGSHHGDYWTSGSKGEESQKRGGCLRETRQTQLAGWQTSALPSRLHGAGRALQRFVLRTPLQRRTVLPLSFPSASSAPDGSSLDAVLPSIIGFPLRCSRLKVRPCRLLHPLGPSCLEPAISPLDAGAASRSAYPLKL
ncbi:hypothetical protein MAPG_09215 [Magnaporthiopsis poae ATCC 64411]|uniref:Uncharacterized protein n=1 Tax=Magnaporthiopsis poae (strain ATCC 64411 / 73-15) TaxID=644358 RepID=A0A0C4E9D4_MAGP6|nr:hypothetical protein MAPG_09215 [Magnaporthiopsis poae ATCC 64411]